MGERYQAMGLQEAGCRLNGLMIRKRGRNAIGQHTEQMKKAFTGQRQIQHFSAVPFNTRCLSSNSIEKTKPKESRKREKSRAAH